VTAIAGPPPARVVRKARRLWEKLCREAMRDYQTTCHCGDYLPGVPWMPRLDIIQVDGYTFQFKTSPAAANFRCYLHPMGLGHG